MTTTTEEEAAASGSSVSILQTAVCGTLDPSEHRSVEHPDTAKLRPFERLIRLTWPARNRDLKHANGISSSSELMDMMKQHHLHHQIIDTVMNLTKIRMMYSFFIFDL